LRNKRYSLEKRSATPAAKPAADPTKRIGLPAGIEDVDA
jgi:hypothetical protein